MTEFETAAIAELRGARVALERIAAVLERVTAEPPADDQPSGCPHPADQRIDFGVTAGQPDWQCRSCGFRTVPPPEG